MENLAHLQKADPSGRMQKAAKDFYVLTQNEITLSPGQLNYVDSIYETTMRGAGFDSVARHADKKRASLKFG